MEFGTNTRTTCVTLYAFGLDQREPPFVTTKPINLIRGRTCLGIIPLYIVTLAIFIEVILELVVTPSLLISRRVGTLEFLFIPYL
jgi:hypothetical protein